MSKVEKLQTEKVKTEENKAAAVAANKQGIAEHKAEKDLKHEDLKQFSVARNRDIDEKINKDKYWFKGTRKAFSKTFNRDSSKLRDSRRKRAVLSAPGKVGTAIVNTPGNIRKSLSNQLASYKSRTADSRQKLMSVASAVGNSMAKSASDAALAKGQREKAAEIVGKLQRELATATEELERIRAEPSSPLVDVNLRSQEKEVAHLTTLLEQKKDELLKTRYEHS
jgi:hypothetical protein